MTQHENVVFKVVYNIFITYENVTYFSKMSHLPKNYFKW